VQGVGEVPDSAGGRLVHGICDSLGKRHRFMGVLLGGVLQALEELPGYGRSILTGIHNPADDILAGLVE